MLGPVVEQAIDPLFGPKTIQNRLHEARVLWASFYGISTLATADHLSKEETAGEMIDTLIEVYIASRVPTNPVD